MNEDVYALFINFGMLITSHRLETERYQGK